LTPESKNLKIAEENTNILEEIREENDKKMKITDFKKKPVQKGKQPSKLGKSNVPNSKDPKDKHQDDLKGLNEFEVKI